MHGMMADGRITSAKVGARLMDRLTENDAKLIGMQYGAEASAYNTQGNASLAGGALSGGISGAFSPGGMFNFGGGGSGGTGVARTSSYVGIPGSTAPNGKPYYGPAW